MMEYLIADILSTENVYTMALPVQSWIKQYAIVYRDQLATTKCHPMWLYKTQWTMSAK